MLQLQLNTSTRVDKQCARNNKGVHLSVIKLHCYTKIITEISDTQCSQTFIMTCLFPLMVFCDCRVPFHDLTILDIQILDFRFIASFKQSCEIFSSTVMLANTPQTNEIYRFNYY